MFRNRPVLIAGCLILAAILFATTFYISPSKPSHDEFAVYAVVLTRLSKDWGFPLALVDSTSQLESPLGGGSWEPAELKPYPPSQAAAPEEFVKFCGDFCGHDFMRKNLRAWHLQPEKFPFPVVSISSVDEPPVIRPVIVTRCGFDLWHRRAVVSYGFDASTGATLHEPASLCSLSGYVLLKRENSRWNVISILEECL